MAIPGRKPKTAEQKRRAGNPGKRPLNENEPQPTPGAPQKPDHLDEVANKKWDDLCIVLDEMGTLATSDQAILTMFCDSWSLYVKACVMIEKGTQLLMSATNTPYRAPWVDLRSMAFKQLLQCSSELGLSPTSRARLSVVPKQKAPEGKGRFFKVVG